MLPNLQFQICLFCLRPWLLPSAPSKICCRRLFAAPGHRVVIVNSHVARSFGQPQALLANAEGLFGFPRSYVAIAPSSTCEPSLVTLQNRIIPSEIATNYYCDLRPPSQLAIPLQFRFQTFGLHPVARFPVSHSSRANSL